MSTLQPETRAYKASRKSQFKEEKHIKHIKHKTHKHVHTLDIAIDFINVTSIKIQSEKNLILLKICFIFDYVCKYVCCGCVGYVHVSVDAHGAQEKASDPQS